MSATDPNEQFHIVIPARYAARRLPGKLLKEIHGKPLILWAYEAALTCGAASVTVATDHADIAACVHNQGGAVWMSDRDYASGSDRVAAVARALAWPPATVIINIQADEVSIAADDVNNLRTVLQTKPQAAIATLAKTSSIEDRVGWESVDTVKVVCHADGRAAYFSRLPIPYQQSSAAEESAENQPPTTSASARTDAKNQPPTTSASARTATKNQPAPTSASDRTATENQPPTTSASARADAKNQPAPAPAFCRTIAHHWHHHLGVYAYRRHYLQCFSQLPRGSLERLERLEQLRALENGDPIYVLEAVSSQPHGIDSAADLHRVQSALKPASP